MKRNNKIVRACTGLPWVDFYKLARRLAYETKLEEGNAPGQELVAAVDAEFCPPYTRHRQHRAMDNDNYTALSTRTKRHCRIIEGREVWVDGTEEIRNQRSYLGGFGRIFAGLVGVEKGAGRICLVAQQAGDVRRAIVVAVHSRLAITRPAAVLPSEVQGLEGGLS